MLSGSASDFPFHSRLVTLQKRQVVTVAQHLRDFQLCGPRPRCKASAACANRSRERLLAGKTLISERVAPVQPHGLLGCLNPPFILAHAPCDPTPRSGQAPQIIARIRLCP